MTTARELVRLWAWDHELFNAEVLEAIEGNRNDILDKALTLVSPNEYVGMSSAIRANADTIPDSSGEKFWRLHLFPVILQPSLKTSSPDQASLTRVMTEYGIVPSPEDVMVATGYYEYDEICDLGPCGMRQILGSVVNGEDINKFIGDAPLVESNRGRAMVLAIALKVSNRYEDSVFFQDDDDMTVRSVLESILETNHGLVDIASPWKTLEPGARFLGNENFLVRNGGSYHEVDEFISSAKSHSGNVELDAAIRVGERSIFVSLVDTAGSVVELREFVPIEIPMSTSELIDRFYQGCRRVAITPNEIKPPDFISAVRQRPRKAKRPLRAIIGGRLQREMDDVSEWGAGIRTKMNQLSSKTTP